MVLKGEDCRTRESGCRVSLGLVDVNGWCEEYAVYVRRHTNLKSDRYRDCEDWFPFVSRAYTLKGRCRLTSFQWST